MKRTAEAVLSGQGGKEGGKRLPARAHPPGVGEQARKRVGTDGREPLSKMACYETRTHLRYTYRCRPGRPRKDRRPPRAGARSQERCPPGCRPGPRPCTSPPWTWPKASPPPSARDASLGRNPAPFGQRLQARGHLVGLARLVHQQQAAGYGIGGARPPGRAGRSRPWPRQPGRRALEWRDEGKGGRSQAWKGGTGRAPLRGHMAERSQGQGRHRAGRVENPRGRRVGKRSHGGLSVQFPAPAGGAWVRVFALKVPKEGLEGPRQVRRGPMSGWHGI